MQALTRRSTVRLRGRWRRMLGSGVASLSFAWCCGSALGQSGDTDFLAQANAAVAARGATADASEMIFPAIAAMDRPPESTELVREVSLIEPGSSRWGAWERWASGEPQQAVIKALAMATDPEKRTSIGFAYGDEGVSREWLEAGLFVDLGKPALLARAHDEAAYLDRLGDVARLCTLEATRLAEAGQGEACLDVLVSWLRLGRMVADRLFFPEKQWGMTQMIIAAERSLDIAHEYPDLFGANEIASSIVELDLRSLRPDRIKFPDGERLAALQLLHLTIAQRGGPKPREFSAVMGRVDAGRRTMMTFSEAAKWAQLQPDHAGWFETNDEIQKIFGDWDHRWTINDVFDLLMKKATDYSEMEPRRFALVERMAGDLESLFDLRMQLYVQITGTRSALGVAGFYARQGVWPPTLAAVQPRFVPRLDNDPWNYDEARDIHGIFQFYVPIRDEPRQQRELPKPHSVHIVFGGGESAREGDVLNAYGSGPFEDAVAGDFRDALKSGIPTRLWDRSADTIDVEAFKEYLKGQVQQLLIERTTMDAIVSQIDSFAEPEIRNVIALVEGPEAAGLTERVSDEFSESDWDELMDEVVLTEEDRKQDPADVIELFHQLWIVNEAEWRRRAAAGELGQEDEGIGERLPVILARLFGFDVITADNVAESSRRMILDVLLSEEHTSAIKRLMAIEHPTMDDIEREVRVAWVALVDRLLGGGAGILSSRVATVELDDSQFVLYSVGPDGKRQMADRVGVGGSDILIWPPLLSLQRE